MGSLKTYSINTVKIKNFWPAEKKVSIYLTDFKINLTDVAIAYSPKCLLLTMMRENDNHAFNLDYEAEIIDRWDERWEKVDDPDVSYQIIRLKPLFSKKIFWRIVIALIIVLLIALYRLLWIQ